MWKKLQSWADTFKNQMNLYILFTKDDMLSEEILFEFSISNLAANILPATRCLECFCDMTCCNWRSHPTDAHIITTILVSVLLGILNLTTKLTQEAHCDSWLVLCVLLLWHSEQNQSIFSTRNWVVMTSLSSLTLF